MITIWRVAAHNEHEILEKASESWFEKGFMPVPIEEWHHLEKEKEKLQTMTKEMSVLRSRNIELEAMLGDVIKGTSR